MECLLPILSDSLVQYLEAIYNTHDNQIAKDLLHVNKLVNLYNDEINFGRNDNIDLLKIAIDSLITNEVRALSMRPNHFEISFTPKGKELKYSSTGLWSREGRQTGKPAKIIKKLLKNKYKNSDLEIFNNLLKAEVMNIGDFRLIDKKEITKYYNEQTYLKSTSTLGASCMRHDSCNDFFKIYEDHAKMLVCIKNDKLLGRAIVWTIGDIIILDRIYVCEDYLQEQFTEYAKDHKWWIKEHNCLLENGDWPMWLTPSDNYEDPIKYDFTINLKEHYSYFPYVDSFRYYDPETNSISTNPNHGYVRLCDTYGGYISAKYYYCEHCNREGFYWNDSDDDNSFRYSYYLSTYLCSDCSYYNDTIDDYVPINAELENVIVPDGVESIPLTYIELNLININCYTPSKIGFILYNNYYYDKSCFIWSCENSKYILKNED